MKKYISIPFIAGFNRSHERYIDLAWEKFLVNALLIAVLFALVVLSVPSTFWRIVWGLLFLIVFPRFVGRFIFSWKGTAPRQLSKGFFCCSGCRRLKPASQLVGRKYGKDESVVCDECNPKYAEVFGELYRIENQADTLAARLHDSKKLSS